jgi:hypothetical protein
MQPHSISRSGILIPHKVGFWLKIPEEKDIGNTVAENEAFGTTLPN